MNPIVRVVGNDYEYYDADRYLMDMLHSGTVTLPRLAKLCIFDSRMVQDSTFSTVANPTMSKLTSLILFWPTFRNRTTLISFLENFVSLRYLHLVTTRFIEDSPFPLDALSTSMRNCSCKISNCDIRVSQWAGHFAKRFAAMCFDFSVGLNDDAEVLDWLEKDSPLDNITSLELGHTATLVQPSESLIICELFCFSQNMPFNDRLQLRIVPLKCKQ